MIAISSTTVGGHFLRSALQGLQCNSCGGLVKEYLTDLNRYTVCSSSLLIFHRNSCDKTKSLVTKVFLRYKNKKVKPQTSCHQSHHNVMSGQQISTCQVTAACSVRCEANCVKYGMSTAVPLLRCTSY